MNNAVRRLDVVREDLAMLFPEDITRVTTEGHPLYTPRASRPPNAARVASIKAGGVINSITIRRNGDRPDGKPNYEIVHGRGRHIDAEVADRESVAEGGPRIRIPCRIKNRMSDAQAVWTMLVENLKAQRDDVDPVETAELMHRYMEFEGKTVEELSKTTGMAKTTINYHLAILECSTKVQKALRDGPEKGGIPLTANGQPLPFLFKKMSREEQDKALEEMRANGATRGVAAKEAVKAAKEKRAVSDAVRPRPPSFVRKWHELIVSDAEEHDGDEPDPEADAQVKLTRTVLEVLAGDDRAVRRLPKAVRLTVAPLLKGKE